MNGVSAIGREGIIACRKNIYWLVDNMKKVTSVLLSVGLVISSFVGILHFFAPYGFSWYSYIPDAPQEIYRSIDYVNFFFSLLLTGLSVILFIFKKKLLEGSREIFIFYAFLVFTWLCRVIITIILLIICVL